MVYAPQTQSGRLLQRPGARRGEPPVGRSAQLLAHLFRGDHVSKVGIDLQQSRFSGFSASRPIEIRRLDGSLAERTVFGERTQQRVSGTEFAVFAQDRWRVGSRVTFELGMRMDRDQIVERVNWSPRAGVGIGILPEGRGILRGGYGNFVQRTPLNVGAFTALRIANGRSISPRTARQWARQSRSAMSSTAIFEHPKQTSATSNGTSGSAAGCSSSPHFSGGRAPTNSCVARSRPGRTEAGEQRHLALQGVRDDDALPGRRAAGHHHLLRLGATASADLNDYDQFFGNLRNPIVRANERQPDPDRCPPPPARARHARACRGSWDLAARAGSAIRVPVLGGQRVRRISWAAKPCRPAASCSDAEDFSFSRPWKVGSRRFRAGISVERLRSGGGAETCSTT